MMLALAFALAAAQTPGALPLVPVAAAPAADPTRLAAAQRLLTALGIEQQYDLMLAQMIPVMTAQIFDTLKDNVTVPMKLRQHLADDDNRAAATTLFAGEAAKSFRKRYPRMRAATAAEYARAFTTEELDGLSTFYASPLGRKALASMPELQTKLMPVGMAAGQEAGREAMQAVIAELKLDAAEPSS